MPPQTADTITYSYGQRHDLAERPVIAGSDMWQVHYYVHPDHRTTWDVSNGRVYAAYEEQFCKLPRRSYSGWKWMCDTRDPLPIAL